MSGDEVMQILGPSRPDWTDYFERRDELVWGWRYCDDWNQLARFFVMFDATKENRAFDNDPARKPKHWQLFQRWMLVFKIDATPPPSPHQ